MATLTNNRNRKMPKKVTVNIVDSIYNVKYAKQFYSWTNLKEIKNYIEKKNGVRTAKQRLFHHQFELLSKLTTVEDLLDQEEEGDKVILTLRYKDGEAKHEPYLRPFIDSLMKNELIYRVVNAINKGFNMGLVPQAIKFGVSGSYFLRGPDKTNIVREQ